jgi:hypothetical protein
MPPFDVRSIASPDLNRKAQDRSAWRWMGARFESVAVGARFAAVSALLGLLGVGAFWRDVTDTDT